MSESLPLPTLVATPLDSLSPGLVAGDVLSWDGITWASTSFATLHPDPHLLGDGTTAAPTYSFLNDPTTGIYLDAVGSLGISTGGVLQASVTSSLFNIYLPIALYDLAAPVSPSLTEGYLYKKAGNPDIFWNVNGVETNLISGGSPDPVLLSDGTAAAPSYSFGLDTNTGIYRVGADILGLASGGTLGLSVASGSIIVDASRILDVPGGSTAAPGLIFDSTAALGIYSNPSTIGFSVAGVSLLEVTTGLASIGVAGGLVELRCATSLVESAASAPAAGEGRFYKKAGDGGFYWNTPEYGELDLTQPSFPILGTDESAATPTYSFAADTDTGLYRVAANTIGFSTDGTLRMSLDTTTLTSLLPLVVPVGSAAAPSLTFTGDSDTGIFHSAADQIGISAGGTQTAYFGVSELSLATALRLTDVAASVPILGTEGFLYKKASPDDGLYWNTFGTGEIDLTTPSLSSVTGILPVANGGTSFSAYTIGDILYASGVAAFSKLADIATGNALITGGVGVAPSYGKIGLTTHISGTLPVANGGTSFSAYTIGDIMYASAAGVLSLLADVATGNAIISGGVGIAPSYGKIGLTTHISGTLPVANGGTNLTSYTVGDLIVASGATTLISLVDIATGNALITGGVGVAPSYGKIGLTTHISGTLPVANGGTSFSAYTTGDIIYASAAGVLSLLADVATGNAIISGGVGVAPLYGKIGLTTHISGTLPVANGGTNITSYTVGDLIVASGVTTLVSLADIATGNALITGGVGAAPSYGKIGLTTHVSGVLPVANGGTSFSVYTVGDITYASAAGVLSLLADVATGNAIISGGVGVAPLYGKIGLTTHISGTLPVANGGTNITSYTIGDLIVASGATTLISLADIATGNALITGGVGAAPSYGKIGLTTHISGTLPVANGGTNITSYTIGDLIVASGATTLISLADIATGNALITGGVGVAPSYGKIGMTTHVSGVLPVANGGTNSSAALSNNRIVVSSGGAIVEASALTNGQLLIGSTGAAPVAASVSAGTGISVTPGAGTLSIANTGVTSAALSMPAEFSVAGSPITTTGTFAVTKATQSANLIFSGPTTGAAAAPTFRALVAADIPVAAVPKTVEVYNLQVTVAVGPTTIAYYPWVDADLSTYTTRTIKFWLVPGSVARSCTVNILPNGAAAIGTVTVAGGSATGIYSFTFTAPGANQRLDVEVSRSGGAGTSPIISGIIMHLT